MYFYLSFLRPPPVSVQLPSLGVTITPQIANDLRTELLDDRSTDIFYTWQRLSPTESIPTTTKPQLLTSYLPPTSTYVPCLIPLPAKSNAGETWRLGLHCSKNTSKECDDELSEPVSGSIPLRPGEIIGVWSEGILLCAPSTSGAIPASSSKTSSGKNKQKRPTKTSAKSIEGVKQTRITRSWRLSPAIAEYSSDSVFDGTTRKRDYEGVLKTDVPEDLLVNRDQKQSLGPEQTLLRVVEETSFDLDKKIWDSGLALVSYLIEHLSSEKHHSIPCPRDLDARIHKPNVNILELGAGTGLVGYGLGAVFSRISSGREPRNARITITDLPSAIPLIDENIELNSGFWNQAQQLTASNIAVSSAVLDWDDDIPDRVWEVKGEDDQTKLSNLDIIIAADVTYNTASFPALTQTLKRLFQGPRGIPKSEADANQTSPILLLAYKQRHISERSLWPLLEDVGIELTKIGTIDGHEKDLDVDVTTAEAAGSGMGGTELWVGRSTL